NGLSVRSIEPLNQHPWSVVSVSVWCIVTVMELGMTQREVSDLEDVFRKCGGEETKLTVS
ncbi:hypothetical protein Tco_1022128, partial [Tanacetum coccineum]